VCAPSSPVDRDRLARSLPILERRYRVRVPDGVWARDGFLAGSDRRRAGELNQLLADPDVRAIFCARGGYGLTRILGDLDAAALAADPIPLVGFSDTTALLGWAMAAAGVGSIHGPVVRQLCELPEQDIAWLFSLLESAEPAGLLAGDLVATGATATGSIEGRLWGGNLSLVAHLVATPWWPVARDAILLLEEVGERPYEIDRYLTYLAGAGALDGVCAAAIGELIRCEETSALDHPAAAAIIDERLAHFGIPALAGLPLGHGHRNRAVPFGGGAAIDFAAGTIELTTAAVTG
jgi:muramoyltetrapeptide carboxypeptidase